MGAGKDIRVGVDKVRRLADRSLFRSADVIFDTSEVVNGRIAAVPNTYTRGDNVVLVLKSLVSGHSR